MECANAYETKQVDCPYCGFVNCLEDGEEYNQMIQPCEGCEKEFIIVE